jgi:hypothetical protein
VFRLGHREARSLDRVEGGAIAVAADNQPVEPVHSVLQAGQGGVVGAQVLDKQELAAGPQHPPQLPQRPGLIIDPAQDQRRDRRVEGVIVEREIFGRRAQDSGGRAMLTDVSLQPPQHRRLGLRYRQRTDVRAVARQIGPGPAADLEHVAVGAGQQLLPEDVQAGPLGSGHLAVVGQGEERGPQAHGVLTSSD